MPTEVQARKILVVDDDRRLLAMVRRGLVLEGFDVQVAAGAREALNILRSEPPDMVVLDVMMPEIDGFELCRRIRRAGDCAILMLTARDAVTDRVAGLESGADDYLVKPFAFEELVARIRAVLRRKAQLANEGPLLCYEDLVMDPGRREVRRGGQSLDLTTREFDLLEMFLRSPGHVLTRSRIIAELWEADFPIESNVIDVHVANLREKLERHEARRLIRTHRGVGYSLR